MTWDKHLATLTRLLDDTGMEAVTKWGKPTYVYAGRNIAMAAGFKHHCGLWFFDGALLSDPLGILENAQEGKTQAMRHWKFTDPNAPLPEDDIRAYLAEAMQHAQDGKRVAPRPKPQGAPSWCPTLQDAFDADPAFKEAMDALTPGRQREYNEHIASAKREATQQSRLAKILPMVLDGKGLNDRYR